ncbi:MAG: hypothetical protein AMXMBFR83_13180 [Phycisphaerae bacterium]
MNRNRCLAAMVTWLFACVSPATADYSGWYSFGGFYGEGLSGSIGGNGFPDGPDPDTLRDFTSSTPWGLYKLDAWGSGLTPTSARTGVLYGVACIDLPQPVFHSPKWYTDVDLTLAPVGASNTVMTQVQVDRLREFWTDHYVELNTPVKRAAFQLAVWEIVYQRDVVNVADYDVLSGWDRTTPGGTGGFMVNPVSVTGDSKSAQLAAANLANTWLRTTIDGRTHLENNQFLHLRALISDSAQVWAFYTPELGFIPAPSAVLLGAAGFMLIGWYRRRFW